MAPITVKRYTMKEAVSPTWSMLADKCFVLPFNLTLINARFKRNTSSFFLLQDVLHYFPEKPCNFRKLLLLLKKGCLIKFEH